MSIKYSEERGMGAFDWFIGDSLVLACCRVPAGLILRVQFYSESWQKSIYQRKLIQEKNSEFYASTFFLQNFVSSLVMHP